MKKVVMEKYTGVKEILAKPMNRKEYNDYRGWELPADENGDDEGFLVEYIQSETSPNVNHPAHAGYISWSPKDVFIESYIKTNIPLYLKGKEYEPHQIRVLNELDELKSKVTALENFIKTGFFEDRLDSEEQQRLKQQLIVMQTYQSILIQRINQF
jgi:hypothetical protein